MNQTLNMNDHLKLEISTHPDRTYLATLLDSHPQFSVDNLQAEVQTEAEYWMTMFSSSDGKSFLQVFESVTHIFDALKDEGDALKIVERALLAHKQADWGEASKYYGNAIGDLSSAVTDWRFAIHQIADDTPFDPYYPSRAEWEKHNIEEPPRSSYEEMREVSPLLFRILHNLDRVCCVMQELVQRQMTCLTNYMQAFETQNTTNSTCTGNDDIQE